LRVTQFCNRDQHDAQEFLAFFIDTLHEDLNKVLKKPYIVERDFRPGEPEEDYYNQIASNSKLRDASIIQDLFYGTFRSVTSCPVCQYMSLKFEPFNMLSVSVKDTNRSTVFVYHLAEFSFFQLAHLKFEVGSEIKLEQFPQIYEQEKKVDMSRATLFIYHNKNFTFRLLAEEEKGYSHVDKDKNMTFSDYLFIIETRNKIVTADTEPNVLVYFEIEGVNPQETVGIKKPMLVREFVLVIDLYRFIYQCVINAVAVEEEPSFEFAFNDGTKTDPVFLLLLKSEELHFTGMNSEYKISLKEASVITVRLLGSLFTRCEKLHKVSMVNQAYEGYIGGKTTTISESLEALTSAEDLDEENAWKCEHCKANRKAKVQIKIKKLPPILIIHLKRFKKSQKTLKNEKLDCKVDFPLQDLDLSRFTTEPQAAENRLSYKLTAAIHHSGSIDFGHYYATAYSEADSKWLEFDDETVREVDPSKVKSNSISPYILFYRRTSAPPGPDY